MNEQDDERIAKGFNAGYLLQKHEPELAEQLNQSIESDNLYFQGLKAGREQYLNEVKERLAEYQKNPPEPSTDKGLDIER